ncbi:MAG: flagellar hook-length control protein FliK [Lachnospiraceae bacterium]|nr:flagellar hook-length control protein FliK [Lachnospiraceae bacterium]MDD7176702.1 flagellar hook-length control protein FliK [bacterium]MDY5518022.1 flagellar hook-length control protein FliK [Lachnospiraceae bacterium]
MQISYVGQYNKNAGQAVGTPVPTKAVSSLSASIKELAPGSIFEGNVSYVKGSNVILSLENGQNIHARLDSHGPKLVQGQSMFFQVKANEGGTVSIRPYMDGKANPTLMRALDAAGLPGNARNFDMVNAMMKEQMPINADALLEMHRVVAANDSVNVNTIVQMTRLEIPITPQLAAQFENYQNDTHLLLGQMDDFMEQLPQFLESQATDVPHLVQLNTQLLGILTEGLEPEPLVLEQDLAEQSALPLPDTADRGAVEGMFLSEVAGDGEAAAGMQGPAYSSNQIGALLDGQTEEHLADVLRTIGNLAENEAVFDEEGALNRNLTARQLLGFIDHELVLSQDTLAPEDVRDLFSQEGYRSLLKQVTEEQWLIQPQDLRTKDKVSELYERLNRQMEQIDKLLKATGNEQSPLAKSTQQIRGNVEFMNEVNQIYNYVQIPLKMNGQNANGDLYVYTNKRKLREEDGELSAFLHLDMEHLGSTDVFVKMKGKAVDTNFAFSDDASFDLVQKYLPILDAKLTALGYHTTITVSNEEKKVDFVEDFLKKDLPGGSTANVVHRYSFDVRA